MSDDVFAILKGLLSWASTIALGLIAWGWKTNAEEHKMLAQSIKENAEKAAALRQHTSDGYSKLNDKIMEHMDMQQREMRAFVMAEDAKLIAEGNTARSHIAKLFDKIEAQTLRTEEQRSEDRKRSEDRHNETMAAIHALANTMHTALAGKADK